MATLVLLDQEDHGSRSLEHNKVIKIRIMKFSFKLKVADVELSLCGLPPSRVSCWSPGSDTLEDS